MMDYLYVRDWKIESNKLPAVDDTFDIEHWHNFEHVLTT